MTIHRVKCKSISVGGKVFLVYRDLIIEGDITPKSLYAALLNEVEFGWAKEVHKL